MKLPTLIFAALAGVSTMAAAQAPSAYYLGRIGLFSDPEHVRANFPLPGLYTTLSSYKELTDFGYATGNSVRFNPMGHPIGEDFWVTNTVTGVTKPIGLVTPDPRLGNIQGITEDGIVYGTSFISPNIVASWVADAESGVTVRSGLYTPEFTSASGQQASRTNQVTDAGLAYGVSTRFNGNFEFGEAIWMMNTDNGAISRAGFFGTGYTRSDNYQHSWPLGMSDLGYVFGHSRRYIGNDEKGQTAWLAAGVTGGTYLVGLYQAPLYLRPDGYGDSNAAGFTNSGSGYVIGDSARFNGNADVGRAAWIHSLTGNTVKRVGLTTAEFTNSVTGAQVSRSTSVSESGYVGGSSQRFSGATDLGQAAWVAGFTDGIAVRVGLTGPEFTTSNGYQYTAGASVTLQGNAYGETRRYSGNAERGTAAWVFNKSAGTTARVGHYSSPEYISTDGTVASYFASLPSDSGWVLGMSTIYNQFGEYNGRTNWAASTNTGVTIPVGLYGPDYITSEGKQETNTMGLFPEGYSYGTSQRYVAGVPLGLAAWAVNLNTTGTTVRLGFFGTPEFLLANGSENTVIGGSTGSGYVWGYSSRAQISGGGKVAWVYNLLTSTQQTFKIQVTPNGVTDTEVYGVTENGLVWGAYAAYHPVTSLPLGKKNFVWSPVKGVVTLEDQFGTALTTNNWTRIASFKLNSLGLIVVNGERGINSAANPGGQGVFRAYFAP